MISFNVNHDIGFRQGLAHLTSFESMRVDDAIDNVKSGKGSFVGSFSALAMRACHMAMLALFKNGGFAVSVVLKGLMDFRGGAK